MIKFDKILGELREADSGTGAVDSVNGQTGVVVLDAADVGAAPALGLDDNYVTDVEKANLHAPGSDNQDLSGLLPLTGGTLSGNLVIGSDAIRAYFPIYGFDLCVGGTVTASAENAPGETKEKAFDDNNGTKWLMFGTTGWIAYQFASGGTNTIIKYTITSGNDEPTRDPKDWQFQGSNDGVSYTTLDSQTAQSFASRGLKKEYTLVNTTAYAYYRLNITANNGAVIIQIAEIEMLAAAVSSNENLLVGGELEIQGGSYLDGGLTINEGGIDADTRIESDTNTHALFVDASSSRVGVNNPDPQSELDVIGTFRFRDAASPTKGVRYRFGGATDVEGGGADMYFSVWQNADFTGTQYNKMVLRSTEQSMQLIQLIEFRTNPNSDIYHSINGQGGVVLNEIGGDNDTRIEGDTDPNLLFIDASTDRVGIGMNNPAEKLDVTGNIKASGTVVGSNLSGTNTGDQLITNIQLTAKVAAIGSTNITGTNTAGLYRVSYYLEDTTADITAGTIVVTIGWTDDAGATTTSSVALPLTAVGRTSGSLYVRVLGTGSIQYSTTLVGVIGTSQYALFITAEKLL